MNKISIALCTYNGAKFLPEQLESYLHQTRLPDELIVCDDCSTDNTPQIIQEFTLKAPFPVHLHINEKNLRSTKNFERAISLCTGDLIFLSDQDDYWMPEKLEKIAAEFEKNEKIGMVFSDAELVDENLKSLNRRLWNHTFTKDRRADVSNGKIFDVLLSENVVTGAAMAFRSEYRKVFMPIPDDIPNLIHDGWISLLIANESKVAFISEPLIKYRQHSAQQFGIGYKTNSNLNFIRRKKHFAASIEFNRKERDRINKLERIIASHSQFAERRDPIFFNALRSEKAEKEKHYEARMNLPLPRVGRIFPVCREFWTKRYHRFSNGILSVMKDLLEKW